VTVLSLHIQISRFTGHKVKFRNLENVLKGPLL